MPSNTAALGKLGNLDFTVLFVRQREAMLDFYTRLLGFEIDRELGPAWVDLKIGVNRLAFAQPTLTADDPTLPAGAASLQLAFRVSPSDVDAYHRALQADGVAIVDPPTDQPWGHRTLFFRDPDGNLLEIFAEID